MSLYDEASLIFTPAGAGGNNNTAHSIKPVEKLKAEELVTNGTFNLPIGDTWEGSANATFSNNSAIVTNLSGGSDSVYQNNVFEVGKTYRVSFELEIRVGAVKVGNAGTGQSNKVGVFQNSGKYSVYHTVADVGGNPNRLVFARNTTDGYDFTVFNVSVKEVEQKAIDFKIDRGSDESATLVGADGFIKKHTHNLIKSTEDFNNTDHWSISSAHYEYPIPEGEIVGYNGSKEGVFTLNKTASSNEYLKAHHVNNLVTTNATEVWTYSVYAKADGDSKLLIGLWSNYDENLDPPQYAFAQKTFTLSGDSLAGNASGGDTDNTRSNPRFYKEKIGDDGWYRLSITNVSAISGHRVRLQAGGSAHVQNNPGKVYVMHPQFEKNTAATAYVKSGATTGKGGVLEDSPRFDYSGSQDHPGLLMERGVTNLIPQSEWFKSWTNTGVTNSSFILTPNYAISPDGGHNATYYNASSHAVATVDNGWRRHVHHLTLEASTKYVFSFYCKNVHATRLKTRVYDNTNSADIVAEQDYLSKVNTTDWTRIEVPFTTVSDSTSYAVYLQSGMTIESNDDGTWNGGAGGGVLWWGAQVEKQNHSGNAIGYASSYIPNTAGAGTVTRQHDDTADTSFRFGRDNIFDENQATIFIESNNLRKVGNSRWWHIFDEDKKEDPRILLYSANGVDLGAGERGYNIRLQLRADHDHTRETILNGPNLRYGDTFKAIARLNNNVITLFVNGTQYNAGATEGVSYDYAQWETETVRPYEMFELAHETGDLGHKIFNLMIFPTILTDDECKNLTSLS